MGGYKMSLSVSALFITVLATAAKMSRMLDTSVDCVML